MLNDPEINKKLRGVELYGAAYLKLFCNPDTADGIPKVEVKHVPLNSMFVPMPTGGSIELIESSLLEPGDWFMCTDPKVAENLKLIERMLKLALEEPGGFRMRKLIRLASELLK